MKDNAFNFDLLNYLSILIPIREKEGEREFQQFVNTQNYDGTPFQKDKTKKIKLNSQNKICVLHIFYNAYFYYYLV